MQVLVLYAVVVLIWGSTWIAITFQLGVVAEEVSVAYRFFLGSIALFIYALASGRQIRIPLHQYGNVVITGTLMFCANYLFTYYAINFVSSGLVAVAFSLMIVTNALFERLFFKTPLERRLLYASILGVAGISCIFWPEIAALSLTDRAIAGILLTLIAVVFASLGNMAAFLNHRRQLPVVAVNAHGMAWGALASAIVAALLGRDFNFHGQTITSCPCSTSRCSDLRSHLVPTWLCCARSALPEPLTPRFCFRSSRSSFLPCSKIIAGRRWQLSASCLLSPATGLHLRD